MKMIILIFAFLGALIGGGILWVLSFFGLLYSLTAIEMLFSIDFEALWLLAAILFFIIATTSAAIGSIVLYKFFRKLLYKKYIS